MDFLPGEVDEVPFSIAAMSVWKEGFDISSLLHGDVVSDDQLQVFGEDDVLLDEVGTLSVRKNLGPFGMFDQIAAGPSVCDDNRRRLLGVSVAWFVTKGHLGVGVENREATECSQARSCCKLASKL